PLVVYMCQFDPLHDYGEGPCSNPNSTSTGLSSYWVTTSNGSADAGPTYPNGTLVFPTTDPNLATWTLDPTKQQKLIIFNPGTSGTIYISLHSYGPSPAYSDLGLPYSGRTSVTVNTTSGSVGRKIQIIVPNG